jgi:ectoine hydroxylase-related dioxygenase (phytanoyl-CoA dioxygenase family)
MTAGWIEPFDRDGYAILEGVATPGRVAVLIEATRDYASGASDGRLARSRELSSIAEAVLGPGAFAIRGLFFDKTPTVNWNLPWHQDLTVAVRERREVPGFGPWTLKGGIPHAIAPADLLTRMVTIRLHLDDCGPSSGPMRVLSGSHANGKLDPAAIAARTARGHAVDCLVPAGGVVVMRPLLLHASASGTGLGHRRVIHLEYAAETLPGGPAWYQPTGHLEPIAPN